MDWLEGLDAHWVWLTLGLVLAGLEFTALGTETNTKLQMFVQMLVGAA